MSRDPAELFEQALALPPSSREAFIRSTCGEDEELAEEILSLLAAHDEHPDLLMPGAPAALPPSEPEPVAVPERIGPYAVRALLGRGGMGNVYEAIDTRTDATVALKVLAPGTGARGTAARGTLEREARALVALDHPCITAIRGIEIHGDTLLLVTAVERGRTLAAHLAGGAVDIERALRIGRRIALALEAAHDKGIEHLDLKPANVIVGDGVLTRVLDFGLARHAAGRTQGTAEPAGRIVAGTPGYMSPEQIDGSPCDMRADLFALGCILFESVTGQPTFDGDTTSAVLHATRREEPQWTRVPESVNALVPMLRACLAKEPARRPRDAREVRRALTQAIGALGPTRDDADASHDLTSLPALPAGPLVGRALAVDHLACLLDDGDSITIAGAGGCGKTRLALEVAHAVASRRVGVAWRPTMAVVVSLAPIVDETLVSRTVAAALDVRETADGTVAEAIAAAIDARPALIVLDNAEHLASACIALIETLRERCPNLRMLMTSRASLGFSGEVTYRLHPLGVPMRGSDVGDVLASDAARLLVERAGVDVATAAAHVGAVATICRRVGGIPLGLELAARAVRDADLPAIAKSLEHASDGADDRSDPGRQGSETEAARALETLLEWSHARLPATVAVTFRRLSVFRGSWTQAAAIEVLADDKLTTGAVVPALVDLADRFLIEREAASADATGTDAVRYRFLEPVREYAAARLREAREVGSLRDRHRRWFADVGIHASPLLRGPAQATWLARLDAEIDNLRAALESYGDSLTTDDAATREHALRLGAGLGQFWLVRGYWGEGRRHLGRLIAAPMQRSRAFANAVTWDGNLALHAGDLDAAVLRYEWAARLGETLGDDEITARAVTNLGVVYIFRRELDAARETLTRGLAMQRSLGHEADAATTELNLGVVAEWSGDLDEARARYEASFDIRHRLGDRAAEANTLNNLGAVAEKQADLAGADAYHERALGIRREIGDRRGIAESLRNRGAVAWLSRRVDDARASYEESLAILRELDDLNGLAETLEALVTLRVETDPRLALDHLAESEALRARCGIAAPPTRAAACREAAARLETILGADAIEAARARYR